MRRLLLSFFLTMSIIPLLGQTDSAVRKLEGVTVFSIRMQNKGILSPVPLQILYKETIRQLPVLQLSDALKFFSGAIIKDYGGVGGIKTISIRGFGANHTTVAYDGVTLSDCQTGQIDLGKISLDNAAAIHVSSGSGDDLFVPAKFLASASLINISTLRPFFKAGKPLQLDIGINGGSFGFINPSLILYNRLSKKNSPSKTHVTSSLRFAYLHSNGNYPFTQQYGVAGDSTSRERRKNSDIQTFNGEANLFVHFKDRSEFALKFYYYHSERGLPGATILYNVHSAQRLWDENAFAQTQYKKSFKNKYFYQINAKFNYAKQHYVDSAYLNAAGILNNNYIQREYYLSNVFLYKVLQDRLQFSIANDLTYNNMNSNIRGFVSPSRFSSLTALSGMWNYKWVQLNGGVLHTYILNKVEEGDVANNYSRFSPYAAIYFQPVRKEKLYFRFFYKNIFRAPTFNDLYYREVGNVSLQPENTHQINAGISWERFLKRAQYFLKIEGDLYYNMVRDKIVAIPTKNLFVWSMFNFGKVEIMGVDLSFAGSIKSIPYLEIEYTFRYSFQHAVDITDPESKTYRHQIPYTAQHSGSSFIALKTKWVDLIYTILLSGKRYALQQNIPENELPAYDEHSIALMHTFEMKKFSLALKGELLNFTNKQYEVIRNYPMQGISFRIGIRFSY